MSTLAAVGESTTLLAIEVYNSLMLTCSSEIQICFSWSTLLLDSNSTTDNFRIFRQYEPYVAHSNSVPAHKSGRAAKILSLVEKQSLTASQLLTTTARGVPRRTVNMGPYLSANAPQVRTRGTGARSWWRWPMKGHPPAASGGNVPPAPAPVVVFLLRHETT
nr:dynein assembly factor with WDR repeat domains 1 [Ipomoea batatas]